MNKIGKLLLATLALAGYSYAVETRFWQQADPSDFEKGTLKNLSLRSDGRLALGPDFRQIFDASVPYLWAITADAAGNLYAGGGGSGSGKTKLFAIEPNGKGRVLTELDGLEIHALATGPDNHIYAATSPDGKVYRVSPQGKSEVFFDPKSKYIWALAFNGKGDLFIATGDQGQIFKVDQNAKGSSFFQIGETHIRSLAVDAADNLIVGTDPGGLVLRVSPTGTGFVLYQTPKREVTAVAIAKSGEIYAAAAGTRTVMAVAAGAPAPPPPTQTGPPGTVTISAVRTPPPAVTPASATGGAEVYRIDPDGAPQRVWSNTQDVVYSIAFDPAYHPLLATGNRGRLYRIDSPVQNTLLIDAPPTQITQIVAVGSRKFAVTGNIGRVYEIAPNPATAGSYESEPFDAGAFTNWGSVQLKGVTKGLAVATRSGNLNRPQENWSAWAPLQNGRVTSPAARFLQYKVDFAAAAQSLASAEIAYMAKNMAPLIEALDTTPANYRFPAPTSGISSSSAITLPPIGQKKRPTPTVIDPVAPPQSASYDKGWLGIRWNATDENGDALEYKAEIRGVGETTWKSLRENLRRKYFSFETTAFPDGEYEVRITATDSPDNLAAESLSSSLISDAFLIDNTPPQISNLAAAARGTKIQLSWIAKDTRSNIDRAEYSLNGGDWVSVQPKTKLTDAPKAEYDITIDRPTQTEQVIAVRVTDANDNQVIEKVVLK